MHNRMAHGRVSNGRKDATCDKHDCNSSYYGEDYSQFGQQYVADRSAINEKVESKVGQSQKKKPQLFEC